jgi:hypothetical protein
MMNFDFRRHRRQLQLLIRRHLGGYYFRRHRRQER